MAKKGESHTNCVPTTAQHIHKENHFPRWPQSADTKYLLTKQESMDEMNILDKGEQTYQMNWIQFIPHMYVYEYCGTHRHVSNAEKF